MLPQDSLKTKNEETRKNCERLTPLPPRLLAPLAPSRTPLEVPTPNKHFCTKTTTVAHRPNSSPKENDYQSESQHKPLFLHTSQCKRGLWLTFMFGLVQTILLIPPMQNSSTHQNTAMKLPSTLPTLTTRRFTPCTANVQRMYSSRPKNGDGDILKRLGVA